MKKSAMDINGQRAELEKLTADQMRVIEQLNEDLKRSHGNEASD